MRRLFFKHFVPNLCENFFNPPNEPNISLESSFQHLFSNFSSKRVKLSISIFYQKNHPF